MLSLLLILVVERLLTNAGGFQVSQDIVPIDERGYCRDVMFDLGELVRLVDACFSEN